MKHLAFTALVRACILFTATTSLIAAIWGLSNSSWAHAIPHVGAARTNTATTAGLPVIVMPLVTVIGVRDPSTTESIKVARRGVREGLSSSMVQAAE